MKGKAVSAVLILCLASSCAKAPPASSVSAGQTKTAVSETEEEESTDVIPEETSEAEITEEAEDAQEEIIDEEEQPAYGEEISFLKQAVPGLAGYLEEGILVYESTDTVMIGGEEYIRTDLSSASSKRIFACSPEYDRLLEYDLITDTWYTRPTGPVSYSIEDLRKWLWQHAYTAGFAYLGENGISESCREFFSFLSEDEVPAAGAGSSYYLIVPADPFAKTEILGAVSEKKETVFKNGVPAIIATDKEQVPLQVRVTDKDGEIIFAPCDELTVSDAQYGLTVYNMGTPEFMRLRADSSAAAYRIVTKEPAYAHGGEFLCRDEAVQIDGKYCWITDMGIWQDGSFTPQRTFAVSDDYEHVYILNESSGSFEEILSSEPVHIRYADDVLSDLYEFEVFEADKTEYSTEIVLSSETDLEDFRVLSLEFTGMGENGNLLFAEQELYHMPLLSAEAPLKVSLNLPETVPNYGISYRDANGWERRYYIMMSGMDGSLFLQEY